MSASTSDSFKYFSTMFSSVIGQLGRAVELASRVAANSGIFCSGWVNIYFIFISTVEENSLQ